MYFFKTVQEMSLLLMFHLVHNMPAEKQLIDTDNYLRLIFLLILLFNGGFETLKARKWADQMTDS